MAKQRTDTEAVLKLVVNNEQAKTSAKEIADAYRKVTAELNNMKRADDPRAYAEKAKNVRLLRDSLTEARKEVSGITNESKKFHTSWKDIASGMVAGFGIGAGIGIIKNFGQQVFDTTAKFQKLEAVLTTTLGSNSQAKLAMQQIQDFAAKTPFQVDELTDSYVRLANQGFKPTMDQLRSLGDLSASTGKDFNQLTEALIDAQTGEFERLKEFGIRAQKNGDQVAFTFKGVTKEVKFTSDSIREYITQLGNTEGVSGSMAAISETLSGKVSNLGDSWDGMLKIVGEETQGVFSFSIEIMSEAINSLSEYMKNLNLAAKYSGPGTSFMERLAEIGSIATGSINGQAIKRAGFAQVSESLDKQIGGAKYFRELIDIQTDLQNRMKSVDRTTSEGAAAYALYADKLKLVSDRSKAIKGDRLQETLKKNSEAAKEAAKETEKQRKEAEKLAKAQQNALEKEYEALKKLSVEMQTDFNISGLEGLDQKLAEIDKKYAPLIEKAKKFKDEALVGVFMGLQKGEGLAAEKKSWETDQETNEKNRKDKFKEAQDLLNSKFDQRSLDNVNSAVSDEDLAAMEYDLEEERLIAMQLLYEAYGESAIEFERELADRKLAERERLNQGHKELAESEIATDMAVRDALETGVSLLKNMVDSTSGMYKALLVVEKAMAISKIIMNTQAEISGYYAKYSLVPGGLVIASGLAAQAKIRAGISIGIVGAQGIAEAVGGGGRKKGGGKKKYAQGGVPDGPSHAQGGIKLVDGITGAVIGEMEGGERILSRRDTQLVDQMIYGKQRQLSSQMSVNSAGILEAERTLRYGTRAEMTGTTKSSSVVNNTTTSFDTKVLEEKMDRFIDAAENAWNYRMFEKTKKRFDDIRSDLDS